MVQRHEVSTEARSPDALRVRANKLDLLERLADDLAHEIKNPLHSMVINLEVLRRRIARLGSDEQGEVQRYVGVLGTELERVSRRIELLLRLARPTRGAEAATLDEMVEELLELLHLEARRNDVEVRFELAAPFARVNVPREPVCQVILDLVLKMLERLGRGGVLRMRTEHRNGEASLVLSGCGPESVPLCEEPDGPLSVARLVAERLGGRVELAPPAGDGSPEERGDRLVFSLPAAGA
jgi:C4-dicarboxylate-specific signal transduction histidine kinase